MPFPKVNYCIVCEGIRQEVGGKFSVLGFFGLTPNVDIGVGKLDQPVAFVVILGFGAIEDTRQAYNHSVVILNPDGSVLVQSPPSPVNVVAGKPGVVAFGAAAVPRVPGLRTVRLIVNGQTEFEDHFMIRQARPEELAGLPGARLQ